MVSRAAIGQVDPAIAAGFSPELYVHPLIQNRTPIYDIRGPIPQQVIETNKLAVNVVSSIASLSSSCEVTDEVISVGHSQAEGTHDNFDDEIESV